MSNEHSHVCCNPDSIVPEPSVVPEPSFVSQIENVLNFVSEPAVNNLFEAITFLSPIGLLYHEHPVILPMLYMILLRLCVKQHI